MTFEKIWTTLMVIDFSNNYFHDRIPDKIGKLVSLHELNLSHNAFDGKIPAQIGGMMELESLALSSNQLSGEIPHELTNLTFLGTLVGQQQIGWQNTRITPIQNVPEKFVRR